ncbi:hypothetical protein [Anaerolinea thermophila]|jgi:hypothetical protein|uniref:Uncharacterized protein n=1 Tax=Anaerolinea thermophila (strain DSM 14523 / JCM 11388 / NBRC 100420 / UNI-1) TaxID=926569 RepID=E8MXW6_ANATU|nr:hypothetical protein [Anaerolinea thermophila]BAJ64197.1 hypothetical protein ANT_21710 [Anaerolinea thermophila UNI-1]
MDKHELQEQLGGELVTELVAGVDDAALEAALLDEKDPLARDLQTAVQAAVDAGRKQARQIVVTALERELNRRRGER